MPSAMPPKVSSPSHLKRMSNLPAGWGRMLCYVISTGVPTTSLKKALDGTRHYMGGSIKTLADLENLEPPTPIDEQLQHLECYLHAAAAHFWAVRWGLAAG
jgi:hypothetical protein